MFGIDLDKLVTAALKSKEAQELSKVLRKEGMQIKVITGSGGAPEVTDEVNEWLTEYWATTPNGVVYDVRVQYNPGFMMATILYQKST